MHALPPISFRSRLPRSPCVLIAGLWNMMRGGSPNLSQTLMRWRVVLQFIALCLVMAAIYFSGKY